MAGTATLPASLKTPPSADQCSTPAGENATARTCVARISIVSLILPEASVRQRRCDVVSRHRMLGPIQTSPSGPIVTAAGASKSELAGSATKRERCPVEEKRHTTFRWMESSAATSTLLASSNASPPVAWFGYVVGSAAKSETVPSSEIRLMPPNHVTTRKSEDGVATAHR